MFIIDSYAVLELDTVLPKGRPRTAAFEHLTRLVEDGELAFPDAVLRDCRLYGEGDVGSVWLIGSASLRNRQVSSFPGSMPIDLLFSCPDLCAPEMTGDQSHIDVACLAKHVASSGKEVVVVTEDPGIGGVRITLAEACDLLKIEHCDLRKMLQAIGLSKF